MVSHGRRGHRFCAHFHTFGTSTLIPQRPGLTLTASLNLGEEGTPSTRYWERSEFSGEPGNYMLGVVRHAAAFVVLHNGDNVLMGAVSPLCARFWNAAVEDHRCISFG